MESNSFGSWAVKARLQDYKLKIDNNSARNKKLSLDDYKSSLISSKNSRKPPRSEISKGFFPSKALAHYESLKNFRVASGIKARNSPSSDLEPIMKMPSYADIYKVAKDRDFYTPSSAGLKELKEKSKSSYTNSPAIRDNKAKNIENKNLNEVISIGILCKATGVVGKGGLENLSSAYMRQLKQFCNEVLTNLTNQ